MPPGLTPERGVEEMATVGLKKEVLGVMMGVVESLYSLLAGFSFLSFFLYFFPFVSWLLY